MVRPKRALYNSIKAILFFLAGVVLAYAFSRSVWYKRMVYPLEYTDKILKYAEMYSQDPHLVSAMIWVESRFRADAVSRRDARGLMQITPQTGIWGAEKIGIKDFNDEKLFVPDTNIWIGCWYLNNLQKQFGTGPSTDAGRLHVVLAAYNGGSGNVTKWLQNKEYSRDGKTLDHIPFRETRNYVAKVMDAYKVYREIYPNLGK